METPIFSYQHKKKGGWIVRDSAIGCILLLLCLNFMIGAVILGFTANWEANGIKANISGDVTCAPLTAGESFMSGEQNLEEKPDVVQTGVMEPQMDERSVFCTKQLCLEGVEDCVPNTAYKNYDCCMNDNC